MVATIGPKKRSLGQIRTFIKISIGMIVFLLTAGGIWLAQQLWDSLPRLQGQVDVTGLSAPVTIVRDALGIPTVSGENRMDVARATGFIHAQERFFQMDLLRRSAAGELAALFGEAAVARDRSVRLHRFRKRAHENLTALPEYDQALLTAYAAGVGTGLADLAAPPWEYGLLRISPAPWLPEDTLLVIYAMYLRLQDVQRAHESALGVMHDVLPKGLFEFLTPRGTEWDTPLQGEAIASPPLPGPAIFDLRTQPGDVTAMAISQRWDAGAGEPTGGSNNWAVSGDHTEHGGALLANDMHLELAVPNIWFRIALSYADSKGQPWQITGVTLPGVPAIVVGSNGHIAWGFTNSEGDWSDLVQIEPVPGQPETYLTPQGPRRLQWFHETIRVKDGKDQVMAVPWTLWGPLIDKDHQGRQRALRWVAHDREAINLELLRLETADTVAVALDIANRVGVPAQNLLVADSAGNIGWTLLGPLPRRFGHEGRLPASWADGERGWQGWLQPAEYPRISNPPQGRLWTANARVVSGDEYAKLGDGGYALGARARQIRDALLTIKRAEEIQMLALQLDDRAVFLERWRDLLLTVLNPKALAADPRRRELRHYVENWGGHAAVDSVGYRVVRAFRLALAGEVFAALTAACKKADARFDYRWIRQQEGPLWRLVTERPRHLLNPSYATWQAQFLNAVDTLLDQFLADGSSLAEYTWGKRNTSQIRHPLSAFIPGARYWLDMPSIPLPGDVHMPRVQSPSKGASQRMVVSPGQEAAGLFQMPVGQSGHPLSPYYAGGHEAWVKGEPRGFLPGAAVYTLRLVPAREGDMITP